MKTRKNFLKLVGVFLTGIFIFSLLELGCSKAEYNNPLDPDGTNYAGDIKTADDDGDGIPNMYDKDNILYVKDTIPPEISILGKNPDSILVGDDGKLEQIAKSVRATDNKEGDITGKVTDNREDVQIWTKGNYILKYTVHDTDGNTDTASRTIVVWSPAAKDTVPPSISMSPSRTTVEITKGETFTYPTVTASDKTESGTVDLTNSITMTETPVKVNPNVVGTYVVTYNVKDADGNPADPVILTVKVTDQQITDIWPAEIQLSSTVINLKIGETYKDTGVSATDKKDGVNVIPIPDNQITRTVKDKSGNVVPEGISGIKTNVEGQYTITYSVSDGAQPQPSTRTRTVNIGKTIENLKPTIYLNGSADTSINVGSTWIDPGCRITDDNDQNLVATASITNNGIKVNIIAITKADTFLITYTVTDKNGAEANPVTRTVTVKPVVVNQKPVIHITGKNPDTVFVGGTYTDSGATVTDDVDKNLVATPKITDATGKTVTAVTTTATGKFTITYTVKDAGGLADTAKRIVNVLRDPNSGSLLDKYAVPAASALATINNVQFKHVTTEGDGAPTLTNITSFTIAWDAPQNKINAFAIQTSDGKPGYYVDLMSKVTNTFKSTGPTFTLTGSGITDLDGEYYVTGNATKFVWVKKDGSFAIIWEP